MAQNDYQTFGDSGVDGVNKLSLANYTADNDRVYGNGYTTKVIRSQLHNKALQQTSKMSAALAQFLANNGQDALDTDSFSTLATKLGLVSTFVKSDTIASLRAMTSIPSTVYVTGYTTANDNAFGSNFFKWNPTSTVADNGGTIIKLTGTLTGRYELQYSGGVYVKWFGAKDNFSQALTMILANGFKTIIIDENYNVTTSMDVSITNDVEIYGIGNPILNYSAGVAIRISIAPTTSQPLSLATASMIDEFSVASLTNINIGDLVFIDSTEIAETGWNTTKKDLSSIKALGTSSIILDTLSNFNYTATITTVYTYKNHSFSFSGITITGTTDCLIRPSGFSRVDIHDIELRGVGKVAWGISPITCRNVYLENIISTNMLYPVEAVTCRDVFMLNITGNNVHHVIDAAAFTTNIYAKNIIGSNTDGTIGFHPTFNVNVDGITEYNALGILGFRSCGGSLNNVDFGLSPNATASLTTLMQNIAFVNLDYDPYTVHDVRYSNFNVQQKLINVNIALIANSNQDMFVDNCTIPFITNGGFNGVGSIYINNSKLGCVQSRGDRLVVSNCEFIPSLYNGTAAIIETNAGLGNYTMMSSFTNCFFNTGYSLIYSNDQTVYRYRMFTNCSFENLPMFMTAYYIDNADYHFVMIGCMFSNVTIFSNHTNPFNGFRFTASFATNATPAITNIA